MFTAIRNWWNRPASKATWIVASLIAVVFAFIGDAWIDQHIHNVNASPFSPALSTFTSVPAPVKAVTPDPWAAIRGCNISFAKVQLNKVPVDSKHDPAYDGADYHETWRLYVFGPDYRTVDQAMSKWYINTLDRWGNQISDVVYNATVDQIPNSALTVWFVNKYGGFAGYSKPDGETGLNVYGFCHKPEGSVTWSKRSDLSVIGNFQYSFPKDQNSSNFKMTVYVGKSLTYQQEEVARFQVTYLDKGYSYGDIGYFGNGAGRFTYHPETRTIWWKYEDTATNIKDEIDTQIPLETSKEIYIVTTFNSGYTLYQRVIFHTDHRGHVSSWYLLETTNQLEMFPDLEP